MGILPPRVWLWLSIYCLALVTNSVVAGAGNALVAVLSFGVGSFALLVALGLALAAFQPPSTPKESAEVPGQLPTTDGV